MEEKRRLIMNRCIEKGKAALHDHGGSLDRMIRKMPDERNFQKAAELFQLISDPTRLKILWLLCHCEVCVNNIGAAVDMSSPAVSHHLRLLKQAGLLDARREGKEMYYKLSQRAEAQLLHKSVDDIFDISCPGC